MENALIIITPLLGLFRNYAKQKEVKYELFLRTPIIILISKYLLESLEYSGNSLILSLIIERWFLLLYKGILSYINNDYVKKREKYKLKYKK